MLFVPLPSLPPPHLRERLPKGECPQGERPASTPMARPHLRHAHDGPPSADRRARPDSRRHLRQLDALDGDLAAHLRIPCDLHRRKATRACFRHRAITIEYELFACHVTPSPFKLSLLSRSIAKLGPRVPFESEMRQRTALNTKTTRMRERTSLRWKPPRPATAPRTPKPLHQEYASSYEGN